MYRPLISIAPMIVFTDDNIGRDIQPLPLLHASPHKKVNPLHIDDPPRRSAKQPFESAAIQQVIASNSASTRRL